MDNDIPNNNVTEENGVSPNNSNASQAAEVTVSDDNTANLMAEATADTAEKADIFDQCSTPIESDTFEGNTAEDAQPNENSDTQSTEGQSDESGNTENTDEQSDEDSFENNLLKLFEADDLAGFEKLIEDDASVLNYQLGRFPLASVAVLCNAEKLINKLINNYPLTSSFSLHEAPKRLDDLFNTLSSSDAEIYSEARFIEPCELFILQQLISGADRFARHGGIKTFSAQKRTEYLLKLHYPQCLLLKGKQPNTFKLAKPRSKKQIIVAISLALFLVALVVVPLSVMFSLRTSVTFYNEGTKYGNEEGFSGSRITIEQPTKDGYTFLGWFEDKDCTISSNNKFNHKATELYAGWKLDIYTINLLYDGTDINGNPITALTGAIDDSPKLPVLKESYKLFLGWYREDGTLFTDSTFPRENITLTPKFHTLEQLGTVFNPIVITDGSQLTYLSTLGECCYILGNDITLGDNFLSCDYYSDYTKADFTGFIGTLDGNGKTITYGKSVLPLFVQLGDKAVISNMNIVCNNHISESYEMSHFGFVCAINNGTIKDITVTAGTPSVIDDEGTETVDNSVHLYHTSTTLRYMGLISGGNNSKLTNCTVAGNIKIAMHVSSVNFFSFGGISGSNAKDLTDCTNNATIFSTVYTAGIAGANVGTIARCTNNGKITVSNGLSTDKLACMCAGIVANSQGKLFDCVNNAEITTITNSIQSLTAGIVARGTGEIRNCTNKGNITLLQSTSNYFAAGIVAELAVTEGQNTTVTDCVNEGTIDGLLWYYGTIGGINSYAYKDTEAESTITISACINKGEVKNAWTCAGISAYTNKVSITTCRNEGTITAKTPYTDYPTFAGGIVGRAYESEITACANIAEVSALSEKTEATNNKYENNAGGLVSQLVNSKLSDCYNTGKVTAENETDYKGLYVGSANTKGTDCTITNCHSISQENCEGWYEYTTKKNEDDKLVDAQGNPVEMDENGNQIYTAKTADNVYASVADMYELATVLGNEFTNKSGALPIFTWEK